jgi:MAF protein
LILSPVKVDEIIKPDERPVAFAKRLALEKAEAASKNAELCDIILAADTIVYDEGHILGKPFDREHAKEILQNLRGRSHYVITAIALMDMQNQRQFFDICETKVPMRKYSDVEIEGYIASGDPMDKAGAYGIQNVEFHPVAVEKMNGCYTNVMGLPLCHLTRTMRKLGMAPAVDIPQQCRSTTQYACRIFEDVLKQ